MKSARSRYHGHRFPPEIIGYAVWVYHRFCLSFRAGLLTPLLSPMPELVSAGTTNELRKRVSAGLPPEVSEFSQRGPEVGLFAVWMKKGKLSK
jgi:hypothetical protein